ncbi:hypothetical protein [Mycobacterium persicum]|uniref:hypothetical protein n=2 Tax=Mycobacteriaceae TaxID=1762 RepID=UPI000A0980E8|nr:hypothetical protein [Mycobacterium persicum]ORB92136.1 hypothetical protein B1T49_26040 [Mycobacterium persicum]
MGPVRNVQAAVAGKRQGGALDGKGAGAHGLGDLEAAVGFQVVGKAAFTQPAACRRFSPARFEPGTVGHSGHRIWLSRNRLPSMTSPVAAVRDQVWVAGRLRACSAAGSKPS